MRHHARVTAAPDPAVRRRRAALGALACLLVAALFAGLAVTQDRGAGLRTLWVLVALVWAGLAVRAAAGLRDRPPAAEPTGSADPAAPADHTAPADPTEQRPPGV